MARKEGKMVLVSLLAHRLLSLHKIYDQEDMGDYVDRLVFEESDLIRVSPTTKKILSVHKEFSEEDISDYIESLISEELGISSIGTGEDLGEHIDRLVAEDEQRRRDTK